MPVRVLKNEQIEGLVSVSDVREPMAAAFAAIGRSGEDVTASNPPRHRIYRTDAVPDPPEPGAEAYYWFNNISGTAPTVDVVALRIDSKHGGALPDRRSGSGNDTGLVFLFDVGSSDLVGILDDHYVSPVRVAATSVAGSGELVPEDATRMGLFGAGKQAGPHLAAFQELCGFDEIAVSSPTPEHTRAFVEHYGDRVGSDVVVADPRGAVEGSDVVVAATNSNEPVFDGAWLEPGTHVLSITGGDRHDGARDEIDGTTVRSADRVYCNRLDQVFQDRQGHLYDALESGDLDREEVVELPTLLAGDGAGPTGPDEITLYKNNTGMGVQFAVVGSVVLDRAREAGVGHDLPDELFRADPDWRPDWKPWA